MKKADVAWEREPDWYVSSPIAQRPYCRIAANAAPRSASPFPTARIWT
jgi:hypothetical protein